MFRGPSFRMSFQWLCWKSRFRNHHGKRYSSYRHPDTFSGCTELFWKPKFQKICLNNLKKFEKNSWFSSGMGWVGPGCHFPILCHWHLFLAKLGSEHYGNHQLSWEMGEEVGTTCEMKLYKPVNQYCPWKVGGIWMKISFILLFWLWCDCIAIIMLLASRTKEWYHVAMHVDGRG